MALEQNNGTDDRHAGFPVRLARWLARRGDVIGVLVELRRTGRAADAVATLLALPDVEQIRTAWEGWLAFVDDADRAACLLLDAVRADLLADAIFALWAVPVRTEGLSSRRNRHDPGRGQILGITRGTPRTCRNRDRLGPC
jgi:hypothetical protein